MIKLLLDSAIEIWCTNYINKPESRSLDDRDKEIKQIEAIPGRTDYFIVEVFKPAREGAESEMIEIDKWWERSGTVNAERSKE